MKRNTRQPRNADEVARCVVESAFPIRRYLCVPNVSWGMLPWEADLLVMSGAGYLQEVEIKMTLPDLKREAGKRKWCLQHESPQRLLRAMWFAMPIALAEHENVPDLVPEFAGILGCEIITIQWSGAVYWVAKTIRKPKINAQAQKQDGKMRAQMARLGAMRYWSLMRKVLDNEKVKG